MFPCLLKKEVHAPDAGTPPQETGEKDITSNDFNSNGKIII